MTVKDASVGESERVALASPERDGVLQRGMFLIAYVWYALEALQPAALLRCGPSGTKR